MESKVNYSDVIIIGAGPAGIFTAYKLIELSTKYGKQLKITIFEKGKDIYNRVCPKRDNENKDCVGCNPCNIMHGFGGAGTFSDCKLSLTPYVGGDILNYRSENKALKYIKEVDDIISSFDVDSHLRKVSCSDSSEFEKIKKTANENNISIINCPTKHLGTDGTLLVMKNMRDYLINRGVEIKFNHDIDISSLSKENENSNLYFIYDKNGDVYVSSKIVVAVGRSGSKELKNFCKFNHVMMKEKGTDIGVRVETDAKITNKITDILYDMKFSYYDLFTGFKARTFCTNPKGYVSEEHYGDYAVANGHSFANKKSNRTNFAVLVSTSYNSDFARDLVKIANKYSKNKIIVNNFMEFMHESIIELEQYKNAINYKLDYDLLTLKNASSNLNLTKFMPIEISRTITDFIKQLDKIMPGLNSPSTYVYGLETKFYSDMVITDNNFKISNGDIYTIGDGAGKTRGIIQSAISGIIAAKDIFKRMC